MDIYNKPSPQEYLAHHGIKGQKWGVRNGPPYPLDSQSHSASEKKAGWQKSLDKGEKRMIIRNEQRMMNLTRKVYLINRSECLKWVLPSLPPLLLFTELISLLIAVNCIDWLRKEKKCYMVIGTSPLNRMMLFRNRCQ